jgi:hypothetical protein
MNKTHVDIGVAHQDSFRELREARGMGLFSKWSKPRFASVCIWYHQDR